MSNGIPWIRAVAARGPSLYAAVDMDPEGGGGPFRVVELSLDGTSPPREVLQSAAEIEDIAFDGDRMASISSNQATGKGLTITDLRTHAIRRYAVPSGVIGHLRLTGRRAWFKLGISELWTVDLDVGTAKEILSAPGSGGFRPVAIEGAAFIAFVIDSREETMDLITFSLDGAGRRPLVQSLPAAEGDAVYDRGSIFWRTKNRVVMLPRGAQTPKNVAAGRSALGKVAVDETSIYWTEAARLFKAPR